MSKKTVTIDKKLYEKLMEAKSSVEKICKLNTLLLDAIPHPAMLISKDRTILAANKKSKSMGAIVGQKCYSGFSTCKRVCCQANSCCFCAIGLDLESIDAKNLEIESDNQIWDVWWVTIDNDHFLHYSIDITDVRESEQNLINAARELKSSNEELEQFAYVASHDLQEPLRVVASYCQLINFCIQENKKLFVEKDFKELQQYLDFTLEATNRMKYLIKDLLEFSKIGRMSDNYVMADINDIINNVIQDYNLAIEENNVSIELDNMPCLMVKKRRIEQVFRNLISNAIKFRDIQKKSYIKIKVQERENDWLFIIEDNGIGIEVKQFERIFGIFKRLHSREEYPGTGIGLALVKKIIENYGGMIWVESQIKKGTSFFFTIPKSWEIAKA